MLAPVMWTDAVDLRDFYASTLGQVARRMIRRRLRDVLLDGRAALRRGGGATGAVLHELPLAD